MAVKPLKVNIKTPTPSAADRMYARQQASRKASGLPEPSEYIKRAQEKQKEIDALRNEQPHSNEQGKFASGPSKSVKSVQSQATPRVNEEIDLIELNKSTVQSYLDKARYKQAKSVVHANMGIPGMKKKHKAEIVKTAKSMDLARKRLGKPMMHPELHKEETELNEISTETKSSYKSKAQAQVKELQPWTKKGEYKDLAKNLIAKRKKGIAKVSEEIELDEDDKMMVQNKSGGRMTVFKKFKDIYKKHGYSPVPGTRTVREEVKEPTGDLKKACWKGYTAVGMKMKNGRKVPNCVPIKEADEMKPDQITTDDQKFPKKLSRKAEIVKKAAKKGSEEKFQANPILDSDVNPQTNKQ